ncbi:MULTISPECIES: phosphoribosylamine--glycine ligase [unclassified Microbacterium]|uniref:phosphoribosylamine--glycine ligase n=1 Tax=unclassified Microbacterium TaxID=2609290 RepID=UPI001AC1F2A9|nr:phosphoribosylamine--glycine ligase [Microbacterium sp.]MBN9158960.1 phosphoribosylamine--glycine ligase [Microbacterium sp.]MBS1901329.1 phosphoribosylamine--glycine ligase [Actinomycetota bacterium]
MKILVLGSGAREHAIILALRAEQERHEILCAPGNAGIARHATLVEVDPMNGSAVRAFADEHGVDLVVIGPEAPLVAGVADVVRGHGIPVFGPGRAAAQLEGSKAFAKRIMEAASVPTGRAVRASSAAEVDAAFDALGAPYVVKADGLAAGKGVIVTDDRAAALAHAEHYLPHGPVLIEEFLTGPEVSLFFLSDGDTVRALSPAQDFKRAFDGDEGPNTGGMGAYSPLPWLAEQFGSEAAFVDEVTRTVAMPVVKQLDAEGTPFIGLLYAGLILTPAGVRVIEFNARFGDPETQVVLPRLRTPLSRLLLAAATGTLEDQPQPVFTDDVAITVVLASEGYPEAPQTGRPIGGLAEAAAVEGVGIVHAATAAPDAPDGDLIATGGRVLNVVATGSDFADARARAYEAIGRIRLDGAHHRTDIAARVAE